MNTILYKQAPIVELLDADENAGIIKGYGSYFGNKDSKTQLGKDVVELMKSGVITENSVGIMPIQKQNKGDYREISEVKLYEISAVTLAANDQAKILDVKGNIDLDKLSKRYDNLSKLIRKGDISDELGYAIEAEILKLKSLFVEFTKPTETVTLPNVEAKANDLDIYNYLINSLKT